MYVSHISIDCERNHIFSRVNNIIILYTDLVERYMGNQYSITVSDETHHILKNAKEDGYKVSQLIDVAVKTLGYQQLRRLRMVWKSYDGGEE